MPEAGPEPQGIPDIVPALFRLGPVNNSRVKDVLHQIQKNGMEDPRSTHQLLSLFQPEEFTDDVFHVLSPDTNPQTLWDQVAQAASNPEKLTIDQKGALTSLKYFALQSLAEDPQEHLMRGGQTRVLHESVREAAKTELREYDAYVAKTLDPKDVASARFFDRLNVAGKVAGRTAEVGGTAYLMVTLFGCSFGGGIIPTSEVPTTSTRPAITQTGPAIETPSATDVPVTPTPTEIHIPAGLATTPEGYSAVHNPDGTWGYGVGADATASIPDLTVDASGAHFRLEGASLDIAPADIPARIQVGQEGALQIYGPGKYYGFYGIQYAWNADQHVWIKAADIVQPARTDILNYITVQTRDQLTSLFNLEPLVLTPFPKDTYFPPPDKVILDYQSEADMNPAHEFSNINPLGKISDLSKSPFRYVNFILLQKGEGRKFDTYIVTEQVYNPADGTFSLLHFGFDAFEPVTPTSTGRGLGTLLYSTESPKILVPVYQGSPAVLDSAQPCYTFCNQLAYYKAHNLIDKNAQMPEIKQWVDVWLTTGKVPGELEQIVLISDQFYIGQKQ